MPPETRSHEQHEAGKGVRVVYPRPRLGWRLSVELRTRIDVSEEPESAGRSADASPTAEPLTKRVPGTRTGLPSGIVRHPGSEAGEPLGVSGEGLRATPDRRRAVRDARGDARLDIRTAA